MRPSPQLHVVANDDSGVHAHPKAARPSWPELVALVRAQVRSLVGATRELEDLTQASLEQVLRALDRFQGRCELSTFTYRIASRVVMNHWRSLRRYLRRFAMSTDDAPEPASGEADDLDTLLQRRRAARLHYHLERLSADQRLAVVLADLEDLTAAQIAEIAECPEATIRSRLQRGRAELSKRLQRDPMFRDDGEVS